MDLARIRNKGRQEQQDVQVNAVTLPAEKAVLEHIAIATEPAMPNLDADDFFDQQPAPLSTTESVSCKPAGFFRGFDPLAVILSGRERDLRGQKELMLLTEQQRQPLQVTTGCEEFLCFCLGNEEYGINIMDIKEIIKLRELTEVPRAPSFVDGVISLRGVIVPVFYMRKRLSMSLDYQRNHERIIIVRCNEGLHGLRVDKVIGVVKIYDGSRETTPAVLEGVARDFVAGIGRTDGRMIIILDIARVVDISLGEVG